MKARLKARNLAINRKSPEEIRDTIARKISGRLHNRATFGLSIEGVTLTMDESHDLYLELVRAVVMALEKAQPRCIIENQERAKRNLERLHAASSADVADLV